MYNHNYGGFDYVRSLSELLKPVTKPKINAYKPVTDSYTRPLSDEDAVKTARDLARLEGIWGGTTSGANVWAALQRAKILGKGKRIVTVIVDSGLKYLNGDLYR